MDGKSRRAERSVRASGGNRKNRRQPVLKTDPEKGLYGPGHNSFTTDEDGNDIMVYHARTYDGIRADDPLRDPNRHAHLLKVRFAADGTPQFVPEPV